MGSVPVAWLEFEIDKRTFALQHSWTHSVGKEGKRKKRWKTRKTARKKEK
jgi:hypothetical protein